MHSIERYVLVGLALLAACGGILIRWRVLKRTGRLGGRLTEQDVHRIVESGSLSIDDDEPLDLGIAEEAEERFWSETWDEAEEY